ncbi:MAG: hypothetical protein BGN82_02660 [Alphaproteobacteria bacterium 65-7]|nr:MAG: hypothetical protein BGN82_02660 [Alphaproteobacteria bacterium 65-7]
MSNLNDIVVDGCKLEGKIVRELERMATFARDLGFEGPALISVHFDGMEDVLLMRPGPGGRRMRNDQVSFARVHIDDLRQPIAPALQETFDILWQSGWWGDGSASYPRGEWLGYKDAHNYGGPA